MSRDFTPQEAEVPGRRDRPLERGPVDRSERRTESPDQGWHLDDPGNLPDPQRDPPIASQESEQRLLLSDGDRDHRLTALQIRIMTDLGKFRVIARNALLKSVAAIGGKSPVGGVEDLVRDGLLRSETFEGPEGAPRELLTLTKPGRHLLRLNRLVSGEQAIYCGFVKPREANHDADIYPLFEKEAARIETAGGRVRRVILDFELRREVNRERARLGKEAQPEIAAHYGLTVVCDKIPLPDLQIEYVTQEGDLARVNLELVTEHYRGRHVGEKARAGFSLYTPRGEGDKLRRILEQHELTVEILSL